MTDHPARWPLGSSDPTLTSPAWSRSAFGSLRSAPALTQSALHLKLLALPTRLLNYSHCIYSSTSLVFPVQFELFPYLTVLNCPYLLFHPIPKSLSVIYFWPKPQTSLSRNKNPNHRQINILSCSLHLGCQKVRGNLYKQMDNSTASSQRLYAGPPFLATSLHSLGNYFQPILTLPLTLLLPPNNSLWVSLHRENKSCQYRHLPFHQHYTFSYIYTHPLFPPVSIPSKRTALQLCSEL